MLRIIILLAALALPSAAAAGWQRAETPHFVVHSDGTAEQAVHSARELEALDSLLRTVTGTTKTARTKLDLYIFEDIAQIRALIDMPPEAGAVYMGGPLGQIALVGRHDRAGDIPGYDYRWPLFHEYSHYFMMRNMSQFQPAWFTEGFASLFESVEFPAAGTLRFGSIPNARLNLLEEQRWLPVGEVFGDALEGSAERSLQVYAQGWLLAHHLYFGGPRSAELRAYLGRIQAAEALGDPEKMFAGGLAGLDADMRAYVGKGEFATRDVPVAALPDGAISVEPLGAGESALIPILVRSTEIEGYELLDTLLAEALPIARQYPDDEPVAEFAAWLAYEAHEYDTARQLIAPFVSAPAPTPRLLTLQGRLVIREALDGADADVFDKIVRNGRRYIEQALKLAPEDPIVLTAMFASYDAELNAPPDSAYDYLARAVAAEPGFGSLRFEYADEMIKKRDYAAAIRVLRPLANAPHASKNKLKALAYIGELEKAGTRR
jgi:hypothetical protein